MKKDQANYRIIKDSLKMIAMVKRIAVEDGESADDIDKYIAENGEEILTKYMEMSEEEFFFACIKELARADVLMEARK